MGFGKWLKNTVGDFKESDYYFKLGCEVMGPPQGMRGMGTSLERFERVEAGKKEAARRAREEQFGTGDVYGGKNWTRPYTPQPGWQARNGIFRSRQSIRARRSFAMDTYPTESSMKSIEMDSRDTTTTLLMENPQVAVIVSGMQI